MFPQQSQFGNQPQRIPGVPNPPAAPQKIAPGVKIGPAGSFGPKTKPDQPYSTHGWDEKMRIQDKVNSSRPKPGQGVRLPSTQQGRPGAVFGGLPGMGLGGGGLGDQVK